MAGDAGLPDLAAAGADPRAVPAGRPAGRRRQSGTPSAGDWRFGAGHRLPLDPGLHGLRGRAAVRRVCAGDGVCAGRVHVGIGAGDVGPADRGTAAVGAGRRQRSGLAGDQPGRAVLRGCRLRPVPGPAHPDRRLGHRDRVPAHAAPPAGAAAVVAGRLRAGPVDAQAGAGASAAGADAHGRCGSQARTRNACRQGTQVLAAAHPADGVPAAAGSGPFRQGGQTRLRGSAALAEAQGNPLGTTQAAETRRAAQAG